MLWFLYPSSSSRSAWIQVLLFNRNKRTESPPFGVLIQFEFNLVTLPELLKSGEMPGIGDLSSVWSNSSTERVSLAVITGLCGQHFFVCGADASIHYRVDFRVPLSASGPCDKPLEVHFTADHRLIYVASGGRIISGIPQKLLELQLHGIPIRDDSHKAGHFGIEDSNSIGIRFEDEDYRIPVHTHTAANWFLWENSAVRIRSTPLGRDQHWPVSLPSVLHW